MQPNSQLDLFKNMIVVFFLTVGELCTLILLKDSLLKDTLRACLTAVSFTWQQQGFVSTNRTMTCIRAKREENAVPYSLCDRRQLCYFLGMSVLP